MGLNESIGGTKTLTGSKERVVTAITLGSFRLTAGANNVGDVTVYPANGGSFSLPPGAVTERYHCVNLYEFQVNGTASDTVIYDGDTGEL